MDRLICADPKHVHLVWHEVSHLILRAMERGDLGKFECVEEEVLSGKSLLWLAGFESAAVTQLSLTEKSKICTIIAMGGTLKAVSLISTIENYAKAEGCDAVRIFGRKGWSRRLTDYRTARIVLEKRL